MKKSKYIYIIKNKQDYYWFNGLTFKFFKLSKELTILLKQGLDSLNELKRLSPNFYNKLKENGFIIEDDFNEIKFIKEKHKEAVNDKNYSITILPTLDCNYSCWYCVQDHLKGNKMNKDIVEKIKKHIKYMVEVNKIESLVIDWFGGEPFMYFNEVIVPINNYAISLCKKNNIPFSSSATTNGYYLKEDIHKSIIDNKIYRYQITLDGIRDRHNKVKFNKKDKHSAFDNTLKNINSLLSKSNNISLMLRINYDSKNLDNEIVEQVCELIDLENRNRVDVFMRKVWQEEKDNKRLKLAYKILNDFKEKGFNTQQNDLIINYISCYAERKYFNAIKPDGSIVKCTANDDLYRDDPLGMLNSEGIIEWKKGFEEKFYKVRFDNKHCLNCKHLPICMGNCPMDWENEEDYNIIFYCKDQFVEGSFNDRILQFIKEQESREIKTTITKPISIKS